MSLRRKNSLRLVRLSPYPPIIQRNEAVEFPSKATQIEAISSFSCGLTHLAKLSGQSEDGVALDLDFVPTRIGAAALLLTSRYYFKSWLRLARIYRLVQTMKVKVEAELAKTSKYIIRFPPQLKPPSLNPTLTQNSRIQIPS